MIVTHTTISKQMSARAVGRPAGDGQGYYHSPHAATFSDGMNIEDIIYELVKGNKRKAKYLIELAYKSQETEHTVNGLPISATIAKRELGRNYRAILDTLFKLHRAYTPNAKCARYTLRSDLLNTLGHFIQPTVAPLAYIGFSEIDFSAMKPTQAKLTHDKIIQNMTAESYSDIRGKTSPEGTEYHSYSNMPKVARNAMLFRGQRTSESDYKNNHPRIAVYILGLEDTEFGKLVCSGKIYEAIAKGTGLTIKQAKAGMVAANADCMSKRSKLTSEGRSKVSAIKFIEKEFGYAYEAYRNYSYTHGTKALFQEMSRLEAKAIKLTVDELRSRHIIALSWRDSIRTSVDFENLRHSLMEKNLKKVVGIKEDEQVMGTEVPKTEKKTEQEKKGNTCCTPSTAISRFVRVCADYLDSERQFRRLAHHWRDFWHGPVYKKPPALALA